MILTTTLAEIRSHGPCEDGFAKIRDHFLVSASDAKTHSEPFPVALLLETNGIADALWVFSRVAPRRMVDAFLIRRLSDGDYSALKSLRMNPVNADWWRDCEAAILRVADLLRRRISGENVAAEMANAYAAARAAADAALAAAFAAAFAAADAALAASAAARAATFAAADAALAATYTADAASAAARDDLLAVLDGETK